MSFTIDQSYDDLNCPWDSGQWLNDYCTSYLAPDATALDESAVGALPTDTKAIPVVKSVEEARPTINSDAELYHILNEVLIENGQKAVFPEPTVNTLLSAPSDIAEIQRLMGELQEFQHKDFLRTQRERLHTVERPYALSGLALYMSHHRSMGFRTRLTPEVVELVPELTRACVVLYMYLPTCHLGFFSTGTHPDERQITFFQSQEKRFLQDNQRNSPIASDKARTFFLSFNYLRKLIDWLASEQAEHWSLDPRPYGTHLDWNMSRDSRSEKIDSDLYVRFVRMSKRKGNGPIGLQVGQPLHKNYGTFKSDSLRQLCLLEPPVLGDIESYLISGIHHGSTPDMIQHDEDRM